MSLATIRFNVSNAGSIVRLTLRPGQVLSHETSGPTDEGWYMRGEAWHHDGDEIRREWCSDGADCDGRLSRGGTDFWDGLTLNDYGYPDWQEQNSSQRDYRAEAAGY